MPLEISHKAMAVAFIIFGFALIKLPQVFPVPPGGFAVGSAVTGHLLATVYLGISAVGGLSFLAIGLYRFFRRS